MGKMIITILATATQFERERIIESSSKGRLPNQKALSSA